MVSANRPSWRENGRRLSFGWRNGMPMIQKPRWRNETSIWVSPRIVARSGGKIPRPEGELMPCASHNGTTPNYILYA